MVRLQVVFAIVATLTGLLGLLVAFRWKSQVSLFWGLGFTLGGIAQFFIGSPSAPPYLGIILVLVALGCVILGFLKTLKNHLRPHDEGVRQSR